MLKRSNISLAVSLLLCLGKTSAAEIYNKDSNNLNLFGKISVNHLFSGDTANNGDGTYSRLGFRGETKINESLTGYGMWEYNFQDSNSEGSDAQTGNRTRIGYSGLSFGKYGSFDYGRKYSAYYDVNSFTDMLPKFGGDSTYTDAFMAGRAGGLATYRNRDFFGLVDGLNIALEYQGKNERKGNSDAIRRSNGDGLAISSVYKMDSGLGFAAAFASINRTSIQNTASYGKGDKAQLWDAAVRYDKNQIYIAAMYGQTLNAAPISGGFANKAINFETVAQYQFLSGLRPSLAFISSRGKDIEGIGDVDLVKYLSIGSYYYFNKNMTFIVEYRKNFIKNNNPLGIAGDDVTALGLTYQF